METDVKLLCGIDKKLLTLFGLPINNINMPHKSSDNVSILDESLNLEKNEWNSSF